MNKKPYFITLTGAKKNIGDFLITHRCEKLLARYKPEFDYIKLPHWQPLDDKLELVNNSKGIIIFGGPGYQKNMYPGVYKLTKNLADITVPIIPLGLGWKGVPGDFSTLETYHFNESSLRLLNKMQENGRKLSCRDYYTAEALRRNGIESTVMTGCPVWYNLDCMGKEMSLPRKVKKVVFTPAQKKSLAGQSVEMMKMLKTRFPDAEIYCSFHRGMGTEDEFTPDWDVVNTRFLAEKAREIGLIPRDTAFDLSKIDFYTDCDYHVGYRVHAHIFFLSMRKPSLLIHEDGRGRGVSEALNVHGIDAFERKRGKTVCDAIPKLRRVVKEIFPFYGVKDNCSREAAFHISADISNGFVRYSGVSNVVDVNFERMQRFIDGQVV